MELAERYMNEPQLVKVGEDETPVITHIEQSFITIHDPRDRLHALLRYLQEERPQLAIVFCRTKLGAEKLCHILHERGFRAECLHGDLPQKKRELVMKRFRERRFNILVATDLAARGLHVDGITHVINYNIPDDHLDYVHRVGRTGRMGKAGGAVTLVLKDEMGKLGEIERALSLRMKEIRYELKRRGGRIPQGSSNAIAAGGVGRRWRGAPAPPTYNL
jgi:ATP-dependent RNA helicase DeaD